MHSRLAWIIIKLFFYDKQIINYIYFFRIKARQLEILEEENSAREVRDRELHER